MDAFAPTCLQLEKREREANSKSIIFLHRGIIKNLFLSISTFYDVFVCVRPSGEREMPIDFKVSEAFKVFAASRYSPAQVDKRICRNHFGFR